MQRGYATKVLTIPTVIRANEFISEIQERHLSDKKADRDLPALRELTGRLSLDEILKAVRKVFRENDRQATKAGIYICHRYSGAKLKEIGELFRKEAQGLSSYILEAVQLTPVDAVEEVLKRALLRVYPHVRHQRDHEPGEPHLLVLHHPFPRLDALQGVIPHMLKDGGRFGLPQGDLVGEADLV